MAIFTRSLRITNPTLDNIAIGGTDQLTLGLITTGSANIAIGFRSMEANTIGRQNVAVGTFNLSTNTIGNFNTALGSEALRFCTTGSSNTAVGHGALNLNETGRGCTALGDLALENQTTGTNNVAVGYVAMRNSTGTEQNVAVGVLALQKCTAGGDGNTALGTTALQENTTGANNVAVGDQALQLNTTGQSNTAVGVRAMENNTIGPFNTAVGRDCLFSNTEGFQTAAFGHRACEFQTTPEFNSAFGQDALRFNVTGNRNTAVGHGALNTITTNTNTALGEEAGHFLQDGSEAFTVFNTTCIGQNSRVSGSNQLQLGNPTTTTYAYGAIQDRSDERDKADVRDTVLGLSFIEALRPVDFKWDFRDDYLVTEEYEEEEISTRIVMVSNPDFDPDDENSLPLIPQEVSEPITVKRSRVVSYPKDGSRKRVRYHHGLIAQEVKGVMDALEVDFGGYQDHLIKDGLDVLTIGYEELVAPLIKAVQELSARVKLLEG